MLLKYAHADPSLYLELPFSLLPSFKLLTFFKIIFTHNSASTWTKLTLTLSPVPLFSRNSFHPFHGFSFSFTLVHPSLILCLFHSCSLSVCLSFTLFQWVRATIFDPYITGRSSSNLVKSELDFQASGCSRGGFASIRPVRPRIPQKPSKPLDGCLIHGRLYPTIRLQKQRILSGVTDPVT